MSVNFHSYLVYGMIVPIATIKPIKAIRGCDHKEANQKFCAECGKPMWNKVEDEYIVDFISNTGDLGYVHQYDTGQVAIGVCVAALSDNDDSWGEVVEQPLEFFKELLQTFSLKIDDPKLILVMTSG